MKLLNGPVPYASYVREEKQIDRNKIRKSEFHVLGDAGSILGLKSAAIKVSSS